MYSSRSRLPNRSQRRATKTGRPSVQRNDIGKITLQEGEALKATAAQLHELKIDGAGTVYLSELTGNPELVGLKPTGGVFADAEGADVGTLVYVLGLARVTDISNMNQEVVIDAYSVSGKTISGTGKVIITGLESPEDSDFAAITPQGGVTINAASASKDAVGAALEHPSVTTVINMPEEYWEFPAELLDGKSV